MINTNMRLSTEGLVGSLLMTTAIAINGNKKALKSTLELCNMLINEKCEEILFKTVLLVAVAIDNIELERKALKNSQDIENDMKFLEIHDHVRGIFNYLDFIEIGRFFMINNQLDPEYVIDEIVSKSINR